ncbi:hypothetical protein [Marinimicrobium sp. ABcell2]|uniref:hypothetical protein n=1 Tax=Marinimicrobium sp. ABcell2 TaxID=3069751 RepID=UPI0027B1B36E|nr:hypothetical protein [Marinimicrobium sp. ABcell2]MDQ2077426.1 hypothetical protein [Marinimicrobium sp. ABcell2]
MKNKNTIGAIFSDALLFAGFVLVIISATLLVASILLGWNIAPFALLMFVTVLGMIGRAMHQRDKIHSGNDALSVDDLKANARGVFKAVSGFLKH